MKCRIIDTIYILSSYCGMFFISLIFSIWLNVFFINNCFDIISEGQHGTVDPI
mgnify:CR=1 FL=1